MQQKIKVFVSYAHEDNDLRKQLDNHLSLLKRRNFIDIWHDREISPGHDWEHEINTQLDGAQIILLLVSAAFLASDYCYGVELKRALEKHKAGETCVIPIILRPVDWKEAPFSHLQALPTRARPVTDRGWHTQDEAFADVAQGIRRTIEELNAKSNNVPLSEPDQASISPKPTNISFTYQPSREGNKGVALFILNGIQHALEYIRNDRITHQIIFLKREQQELVRLVVPFATLKSLEERVEFQIDGVNCLFTFKMRAVTSIMSVKLEVGGVEIFRQ
ncbi:MAG TPA: toll/interleukin-1 receptor domain-containing protein [Ktedonobacteraceae bacterium]|jgi:hypothetical protein